MMSEQPAELKQPEMSYAEREELERKENRAKLDSGELVGILFNCAYGGGSVGLNQAQREHMKTLDPEWTYNNTGPGIRTDQLVIKAYLDNLEIFKQRRRVYASFGDPDFAKLSKTPTFEMRDDYAVEFVHPDVIEARAWVINVYDGAESIEVREDRLMLWKIRQCLASSDSDKSKLDQVSELVAVEEDKCWYYGHMGE